MMAYKLPETSRTLCTYEFGPPSKWEISNLPTPKITQKDEVIIKVHAAAINPTDIGGAAGRYWPAFSIPLPYEIGFDLAGTVSVVGSDVSSLKVGDEVFCCLPFIDGDRFGTGSISEYVLVSKHAVVLKPKNLTFVEAASLPLVSLTAVQMFGKVLGGVEGKFVFVPAGLSGVGSIAAQMAKNVYGAKRVITTVSTTKTRMVDKLLGDGVVDEIVDYKMSKRMNAMEHGSVDVMIDSVGAWFSSLPLLKKGGMVVACAGAPFSGRDLLNISPNVFLPIIWILNLLHFLVRAWIGRYSVNYDTVLMKVNGNELEMVRGWVEEGKIKPVVGNVLKFRDIEGIREECVRMAKGKGGVGKVVVQIIAD